MHLENKGDKDIILQALAGSAHEPRFPTRRLVQLS